MRDLLQTYEEHYDFVVNRRKSKTGVIEDVYDGKCY